MSDETDDVRARLHDWQAAQSEENLRSYGIHLAAMWRSLVAGGVPHADATDLVRDYQDKTLEHALRRKP